MRRELTLTVCPISNVYVTDSLKALEIRRMLKMGMRATVNSDDPAYFPGYMTENLIATHEAAELERDQIVQLAINAFEGSWLPVQEKNSLLRQLDSYVALSSRSPGDRLKSEADDPPHGWYRSSVNTRGFSHFVTSMTAPVASGWSDGRVGLAPTEERRLSTAHTQRRR